MPDTAAIADTTERISGIRLRVNEIDRLFGAGDSDRGRKTLLNLVQEYRDDLPANVYSAAIAKAGEFINAKRDFDAGYGDSEFLAKLQFQMLKIATAIPASIEEHVALTVPRPTNGVAAQQPVGLAQITPVPPPAPPPAEEPATPTPPEAPVPSRNRRTRSATILSAERVSKTYGSTEFSLKDISFGLRVGEITAVVGRNGSGKSTLLNITLGLLTPDFGTLSYPLHREGGRLTYGYVQQRPAAWRGKLRENLEFIAAAHGIRGNANRDRVDWLLARFDLVGKEHHQWRELSGGYQLRYELAKALVHRPQLLVLDEPLAHLDLLSQEQLLWDLKSLADSNQPASVLITSQHLFEMESIADQLIVLQEGQAAFVGAADSVNRQRSYNRFEVSSVLDQAALIAGLGAKARRVVEINGFFQIDTDIATTATALLGDLQPGELRYFRDISTSAKSLMIDQVKLLPVPKAGENEGDAGEGEP